jgi:hypothetical protein
MLSFSFSYPDLIKFHYSARIPLKEGIGGESGGHRGERDGYFMDNSKFLCIILCKSLGGLWDEALGYKQRLNKVKLQNN